MVKQPLLLTVAALVLLAIASVFWFIQKRQVVVNQPIVTDPVGEAPIQVDQQKKADEIESVRDLIDGEYAFTPVDTSDWKTYRNEEYGFEVKYPVSGRIEAFPASEQFGYEEIWHIYVNQTDNNPFVLSIYSKRDQSEAQRREMVVFSDRYHEQQLGNTIFRTTKNPYLNEEAGAYEITSWTESLHHHFFFRISDNVHASYHGRSSEEYTPLFPTRNIYRALLSSFQLMTDREE